MEYFREWFFSIIVFVIGYLIFKNDLFKWITKGGTLDKDFKGCYILKYPNRVEFHNKGQMYLIDFDEFFEINPKLKGKIRVIERPLLDGTSRDAIQKEIEIRKEIRLESSEDFWENRKKV